MLDRMENDPEAIASDRTMAVEKALNYTSLAMAGNYERLYCDMLEARAAVGTCNNFIN